MQSKFIIEFNKELSVKHQTTKCDGEEVRDVQTFEDITCFLDFQNDLVEFEFDVNNHHWQNVEIEKKVVAYEITKNPNFRKQRNCLQIVDDNASSDSSFTSVKIQATFKDVLLHLFSPHHKEFKLIINYKMDFKKFQVIYFVLVPEIKQQKEWYASGSMTDIYLPEQISGPELVNLFKQDFKLMFDSSQDEASLQTELLEYANSSTAVRFKNLEYLEFFRIMLAIDDMNSTKLMEDYSLSHQRVLDFRSCYYNLQIAVDRHLSSFMCRTKTRDFLKDCLIIQADKKLPNDASEFDYVYLTDMEDYQNYHEDLHEIVDYRIVCKVHYIFGNLILLKQQKNRKRRKNNINDERNYHVQFIPNRIAIRVAHRAIDDALKCKLVDYLCDFDPSQKSSKEVIQKFAWMNSSVSSNKEQQKAVRNIVNRSSFPSPYIVFGPPGTGKSTTIIEAIAQIVKLKPKAHILVTTRSNAACDDIGNRLLKYVSVNKVLRIYSPALDRKPEMIDKVLEPISNFRSRHLCLCKSRNCPEIQPCDDPTYEEFYTSRVIISTLVSCGRIVSAGIKSDHFDYIFIDEAASESEQYTLIPIAGLGTNQQSVRAQIVLSGDHKQLGPIVIPKFCQKMGMEKSMMERMMETNKLYLRSPTYNQKFVTQLKKNYRSHPALLEFSNANFYDSQLEAMCPRDIANFAVGWEFLMFNKEFPLLFHATRTRMTEVGMSLMNAGEVHLVDSYVQALLLKGINGKKVLETDIGIISPYKAQRDKLREQFENAHPKIEIGTVDSFQGREKKIIIMSTVRSGSKHVGFLRNEKRLNVSLTRAKCLLIIVGNSVTLQKCPIWNKFIAYCIKNHAIVGDILSINATVALDPTYQGNEEKPAEIEDEYDDY